MSKLEEINFIPPAPLRSPVATFDDKHYSLNPDERAFFKTQIGIQDDEELKEHIKKIQAEAYEVSVINSDLSLLAEVRQFLITIFLPCPSTRN